MTVAFICTRLLVPSNRLQFLEPSLFKIKQTRRRFYDRADVFSCKKRERETLSLNVVYTLENVSHLSNRIRECLAEIVSSFGLIDR